MSAIFPIESASAAEPPRIIPPPATLFAERARRFAQLAERHVLGDWLRFLGRLAEAQDEALQEFPDVPLPDSVQLSAARRHAMPPLSAHSWPRVAAWRDALRRLATTLAPLATPAAHASLDTLRFMDAARLDILADQVLESDHDDMDVALLPFVGAALEVYWTAMAARLGEESIAPLDVPGVCPCCGFLPVMSVVRVGAANRRYLHCALCNTEWNLVRVKCAVCGSVEGIAYHQIEHGDGAIRAETCEACNSYLKIIYQSNDSRADPVADDLAGLALDVLVDRLGYQRAGPSLLFVPGEG